MNFRYLVLLPSLVMMGCQSKPTVIYEGTARDYADCKEMLSEGSLHPVWDQPNNIQAIEVDFCEHVIFETEFEAAVREREENEIKDTVK